MLDQSNELTWPIDWLEGAVSKVADKGVISNLADKGVLSNSADGGVMSKLSLFETSVLKAIIGGWNSSPKYFSISGHPNLRSLWGMTTIYHLPDPEMTLVVMHKMIWMACLTPFVPFPFPAVR